MNKNKEVVETAKNSQPTQNNKVPTGKIKTLKTKNAIKKEREEQYRNFRINSLKRRAKRMNIPDEEVQVLVEKLKAQLDAPKEYHILVMLDKKDANMFKEALVNNKLTYKFHGDDFFAIDGNQDVLAKIREIAPQKAKIHTYAKKMESVFKEFIPEKPAKKPTSNTAEKKATAKKERKIANSINTRKQCEKFKKRCNLAALSREELKKRKAKIKALKAEFKALKKKRSTTVRKSFKNGSKGFKTASTNFKQAA